MMNEIGAMVDVESKIGVMVAISVVSLLGVLLHPFWLNIFIEQLCSRIISNFIETSPVSPHTTDLVLCRETLWDWSHSRDGIFASSR